MGPFDGVSRCVGHCVGHGDQVVRVALPIGERHTGGHSRRTCSVGCDTPKRGRGAGRGGASARNLEIGGRHTASGQPSATDGRPNHVQKPRQAGQSLGQSQLRCPGFGGVFAEKQRIPNPALVSPGGAP